MVRAGNVAPTPDLEVIAQFKADGRFQPWRAAPFDGGVIDQVACYQALAECGFDGVVSLKTAGNHADGPLAAIRHSWRALNDAVKKVR